MKNAKLKLFGQASLLFVVVVSLIVIYAFSLQDSSWIFPTNSAGYRAIIQFYVITFTLTLVAVLIFSPKIVKAWATRNYWKGFLTRFLPKFIFYFFLLSIITVIVKGPGNINFLKLITISIPVLVIYTFIVSNVEEIIFGGLIYATLEKKSKKGATILTTGLFALWHLVKTGGNIVLMLTYIPLRLWWIYERNTGTPLLRRLPYIGQKFFGPSPETQQGPAGAHTAWNMFVIGIQGLGGGI